MLPFALTKPNQSLAAGYPAFVVADAADAGIAEGGMILGDENTFGSTHHAQHLGIHLPDEEWCAVAHDIIVVGTLARVHEKQSAAHRHPMLLRVVTAQYLAIVKPPFTNGFEVNPILAACDKRRMIRAQG